MMANLIYTMAQMLHITYYRDQPNQASARTSSSLLGVIANTILLYFDSRRLCKVRSVNKYVNKGLK
jgi:hypothetical protein